MKTTALLACLLGFTLCAHAATPATTPAPVKPDPKKETEFTFKGTPMGATLAAWAKSQPATMQAYLPHIPGARSDTLYLGIDSPTFAECSLLEMTLYFKERRAKTVAAMTSNNGVFDSTHKLSDLLRGTHTMDASGLTLERVVALFEPYAFDKIADALTGKYGKPAALTAEFQTVAGAKYDNTILTWVIGDVHVELAQRFQTLQQGRLLILSKTAQAGDAAADKNAAKDI